MSLEYYLYCRKEYNDIISYIDAIIEKYDLINDITISEPNLDAEHYKIFKTEHNKLFFLERQKQIKEFKKLCNEEIMKLCEHDFEVDLIDIKPEVCMCIEYCKICEYTKDK
jgi:hypothetical protein